VTHAQCVHFLVSIPSRRHLPGGISSGRTVSQSVVFVTWTLFGDPSILRRPLAQALACYDTLGTRGIGSAGLANANVAPRIGGRAAMISAARGAWSTHPALLVACPMEHCRGCDWLFRLLLSGGEGRGNGDRAAASVSAEQNPSAGVIEHHRAEPAHLVGAQEATDTAQAA
jgi:hypothetical protein